MEIFEEFVKEDDEFTKGIVKTSTGFKKDVFYNLGKGVRTDLSEEVTSNPCKTRRGGEDDSGGKVEGRGEAE